jgi:multisubunit Na+/H+ antiporter MnhB subunit
MGAKTPRLEPVSTPGLRWSSGVACGGVAAVLGWAVLSLPPDAAGLTERALVALSGSGVSNPVTAALLNYRAYDTLLEVGVLLLAVVATWAMACAAEPPADIPRGPVLRGLARVLAPVLIVLAGHFLWIGSSRPGGAFQSGALLGGTGVLLLLAYRPRRRLPAEWVSRSGCVVGLAIFLAVAAVVTGPDRRLLEYPPDSAAVLILLIEAAAAVSIGVTLAALFLGGRPAAHDSEESGHSATRARS